MRRRTNPLPELTPEESVITKEDYLAEKQRNIDFAIKYGRQKDVEFYSKQIWPFDKTVKELLAPDILHFKRNQKLTQYKMRYDEIKRLPYNKLSKEDQAIIDYFEQEKRIREKTEGGLREFQLEEEERKGEKIEEEFADDHDNGEPIEETKVTYLTEEDLTGKGLRINHYGDFQAFLIKITKKKYIDNIILRFNSNTETMFLSVDGKSQTDRLFIIIEPITSESFDRYNYIYTQRKYDLLIDRIITDQFVKDKYDKSIPQPRDIYVVNINDWYIRLEEKELSVITPARREALFAEEKIKREISEEIVYEPLYEEPSRLSYDEKIKYYNDDLEVSKRAFRRRMTLHPKDSPEAREESLVYIFHEHLRKKAYFIIKDLLEQSIPIDAEHLANEMISQNIVTVIDDSLFALYQYCFILFEFSLIHSDKVSIKSILSEQHAAKGYEYRLREGKTPREKPTESELWISELKQLLFLLSKLIKLDSMKKVSPYDIFSYIIIKVLEFDRAIRNIINKKSSALIYNMFKVKENVQKLNDLIEVKLKISANITEGKAIKTGWVGEMRDDIIDKFTSRAKRELYEQLSLQGRQLYEKAFEILATKLT